MTGHANPVQVKHGDGDVDMGVEDAGMGSNRVGGSSAPMRGEGAQAAAGVGDGAPGGEISGVDEAAEALIGLVGMGARMDEDGHGGSAGSGAAKIGPGRVVWAKVEGHDWWPARVVRRRAVPREVRGVRGGGGIVLPREVLVGEGTKSLCS